MPYVAFHPRQHIPLLFEWNEQPKALRLQIIEIQWNNKFIIDSGVEKQKFNEPIIIK